MLKSCQEKIIKKLEHGEWDKSNEFKNVHESNILKLDSTKIQNNLNYLQCLTLDETIDYTVNWYKKFSEKQNMFNFSIQQIENYLAKASLLNVKWIQEYNV